jgi:hypothetical protein
MPIRLAEAFRLVPVNRRTWVPPSWDGIPGERFSALGQVCHVRDIEILGYQIRFARMLDESVPSLVSLDSYELAKQRNYDAANPEEEIEAFSVARGRTIELLESIEESQFERAGTFGEYGNVSLRSLVHYLASHDNQHLACIEWLLGQIHAPLQH